MRAKVIIIVLLAIILTSCSSTSSDQDFDDKSKAVREFAIALLSANAESAKSLSAPEKWNEVDEWVKEHSPISCPTTATNTARDSFDSPQLSGGSWFTSGTFDEQTGKWLVDAVYECQNESVTYCFEMNGTEFEKIDRLSRF
jgi:type II secretory pathway pseudopilin PulG